MKILVVEDEVRQQDWLTRNLSSTGHEVTTACDGDWALVLWMSNRPFDVVITDYLFLSKKVPDGKRLIELIRVIDPGQPFIMQTDSAHVDLPRGVPLLHRPYPIRRLLRLIASTKQQRLPLFPLNSASR